MPANKRPTRPSLRQTEALLARITDLSEGKTGTSLPQQPRQESYAGWNWESGSDPYILQTGD